MGSSDSVINCFNCMHFNRGKFTSDRRGCELHDFLFPDVGVEILCADFGSSTRGTDDERQVTQRITDRTALWYHLYPYSTGVYRLAEFAELQCSFFGSELLSAIDITFKDELKGVVIDLAKAYRLWGDTGQRTTVRLSLGAAEFQSEVLMVDYRYKSTVIQKLILYSREAQDSLQTILAEYGSSDAARVGAPVLGFIGVSDDFHSVSFVRNEVTANF